jgi:hypothetical protein
MALWDSKEFQGNKLMLDRKRPYLNHEEKSVRTFGKCCWRVFS